MRWSIHVSILPLMVAQAFAYYLAQRVTKEGGELVSALVMIVVIVYMEEQRKTMLRQHKALKWFANHVKIDRQFKSDPVPEDLQELVVEEDDPGE